MSNLQIIPTWETCNWRDDTAGMKFASWVAARGFPTGTALPKEIVDLLVDASIAHDMNGGDVHDGRCGQLLRKASILLVKFQKVMRHDAPD